MSTLLECAHALAAAGWPVIPLHTPVSGACDCRTPDCASPGKHPRTRNGLRDATIEPEVIAGWWRLWPDANIGAAVPEGFFVLDVDGPDGEAALAELAFPPTATVRTGRGRHLIFRTPVPIGPKVGVRPQVDVRGPGSYVVVPPSRHPNGQPYEWLQTIEQGVADAPDPLIELITARRAPSSPSAPREPIPDGERNATLTSLAGTMRRRGMTVAAIEAALLAENGARCQPPLPAQEVRAIAASVGRYDPATPAAGRGAPEPRDQSDQSDRSTDRWPESPQDSLFLGLAGRIVDAIDPHTEADPLAVLGQLIVMFGSAIGSRPHAMVGATRHGTNTNVMVVGDTSKARKGDSLSPVRRIFSVADPDWGASHIRSGFGSGEGVIWAVRDPLLRLEPVRDRDPTVEHGPVVVDPGEPDKRLLIVEAEVARILRVTSRQGSILSMIIRDAWDGGDLSVITKGTNLRATAAHVSVIGHVTAEELRRELSDTEAANGFMNRWLVLAVRRAKLLPEPEPFEGPAVELLAEELRRTIAFARVQDRITRSPAARELWVEAYPTLSQAHPGLVGAMLARAEAHVLRLSMIYALLDCSALVEPVHLAAAFELWAYAERSVRFLFGEATGNPLADRILGALDQAGELTRTRIRDLLGRHASEVQVDSALGVLLEGGRARVVHRATDGRPAEVWRHA